MRPINAATPGTAEVVARGAVFRLPVDPVYLADARDHGVQLLAESLELEEGDVALVAGDGGGLLPTVASTLARSGRVLAACGQVGAAAHVERTAALNGADNVEVLRGADLSPLRGYRLGAAAITIGLAPSATATRRLIEQAALLLRPGGRCYVAGGKREGILSAADHLETVFGNVRTVAYRKGHRVVTAVRQEEVRASWAGEPARLVDVVLRGRAYRVAARGDVFAEGELDEATRLLVESMRVGPRDTVLDLGCGSGLIGLTAAGLAPAGRVTLVDSSYAAIELATQNLRLNAIGNAEALASDGFSALQDARFDVVATNPPFHVGKVQTTAVAERLIAESAAHLRDGGRLYVVASRFLKYEPVVERCLGGVETIAATSRFKVLLAVRARPARGRPSPERPGGSARPR